MKIEVSGKEFKQDEILTCAILTLLEDVEVRRGKPCELTPLKAWDKVSAKYPYNVGQKMKSFIKSFSCPCLDAIDPKIGNGDAQYMVSIDIVSTILQHKIQQLNNIESVRGSLTKKSYLGKTYVIVKTERDIDYLKMFPGECDIKVIPTKSGFSSFDKSNKLIRKGKTLEEVLSP